MMGEFSLFLFFFIPILVLLIFIILTVTLTVHLIKLTNPTLSRPIPCPCRVPGTHRKICNRKVMKDFTTLLIISSTQMFILIKLLLMQMCCKGALRLCHCKEKNDCQSLANVVDAAYTTFKQRDREVKEDDKWKDAANNIFKGREDNKKEAGEKN